MIQVSGLFMGGGANVQYATGNAYTSVGSATSVDVTNIGFYPNIVVVSEQYSAAVPFRTRGPILTEINIAPTISGETFSISNIFDGGFTISRTTSKNGIFTWHAFLIE